MMKGYDLENAQSIPCLMTETQTLFWCYLCPPPPHPQLHTFKDSCGSSSAAGTVHFGFSYWEKLSRGKHKLITAYRSFVFVTAITSPNLGQILPKLGFVCQPLRWLYLMHMHGIRWPWITNRRLNSGCPQCLKQPRGQERGRHPGWSAHLALGPPVCRPHCWAGSISSPG